MRIFSRWGARALLVFMVASGGAVLASHASPVTIGDFEIDGNTADDASGGIDWDTFPEAIAFTDPEGTECGSGLDNIFAGSSKEQSPGQWGFGCGSAPSKDDILSGAIGQRKIGSANWVYVRFSRLANTGSANLSAEFNALTTTYDNDANPATPQVPVRSNGDLLVFLGVTNGGAVTTPEVFKWSGTHVSGLWVQTSGSPVRGVDWDAATNANAAGKWTFAETAIKLTAFGFVESCPGLGTQWLKTNSQHDLPNGTLKDRTIRKPLNLSNCATKHWAFTFDPKPITGATVHAVYTVAGGGNRTALLVDPDGDGTFRATDDRVPAGTLTYRFEVRNGSNVIWQSAQGSETMQSDSARTNAGSLSYGISLTPDTAENFDDDPHTFTARVFEAGTDVGLPHVPVNFGLLGGTPSGCGTLGTTSGVTGGGATLTTEVSSTGPCTVSLRAWVNGAAAGSTSGFDAGEANDTSTKVFVRYAISVAPASANNEVNRPHTFTVTLTRDTGSGPAVYAGGSLSLTLSPGTTDAHFTQINGNTASGTSGTCTTDGNGRCAATIIAATPGNVTLTASYLATDGQQNTRTITGTGAKNYRTFALSIAGGGQTNKVGDPHDFAVTLTQNTGSGPAALSGQTITLTLNPGSSDAHFTAINGNPASGTSGTCTTDGNGGCAATIVASTPGSVTLTADWTNATVVQGGASRTATASKQYVAFALSITPANQTNEVGDPHTFTLTLTKNTGTASVGLAGETITLTLNPGTTDAHFTAIDGDPASGTSGSCSTDSLGRCTATIVASTPGSVSVTGNWSNTEIVEGGASASGTANKQYLAFALTVTPANQTNEVGDPHTFTITLTKDSGSGPAVFAGETITLTLNPGPSDARFTSINGNPASGTSRPCTTNANGQCSAVIMATSPGSVTLTATWANATVVNGGASRTATANKQYLAFSLSVTPASAYNRVNRPHTFTVTLTKNGGSGPVGLAGETIQLTLTPAGTQARFTQINGAPASGTTGSCTTDADGRCLVTINSPQTGVVTLTAVWNNQTIVVGGASRTALAEKTYFDVTVTKTACPAERAPRGAILTYDVGFTLQGATLPSATFEDVLPPDLLFVGATTMGGVTPSTPPAGTPGGTVRWSFTSLAPGNYGGTITVRVADAAPLDQSLTNLASFAIAGVAVESDDHSILISDFGRRVDGRAFGVSATVQGQNVLPITPDSNVTNPGEVLAVPDPFGGTEPLAAVIRVRETDESVAGTTAQSSVAVVESLRLAFSDLIVEAEGIVARSRSHASAGGSGSTHAGSRIQTLRVNRTRYDNVTQPTRIEVRNPESGSLMAVVLLLERDPSGAAAGSPQPDGPVFDSGLAVNGIHVIVYDDASTPVDESIDAIVSHAESSAAFPSGLACGLGPAAVGGRAAVLQTSGLAPDAADVTITEVNLPVTGGSNSSTMSSLAVPPPIGWAGSGTASTEGEIADGPDADTVPVEATSVARVNGLDLLDSAITADHVKATSFSTPAASSAGAVIDQLVIAGTRVCAACTPDPNEAFLGIPETVVLLNEQYQDGDGLTVNAVHIYVVGDGNPLGLPAGAEIIISSARSAARNAPSPDGPARAPTRGVRPPVE